MSFFLTKEHKFRRGSKLTTHRSMLIAQRRLSRREARRANSRGFLNPWNNDKIKKWRLQRRGTATLTTDSRLCRRHYCVVTKNRGLESPRLFKSTSSRRFRSTFSFDVHRSLSRHPELVSGSVRGNEQEKLAVRC